ncbi:hypothetical protein ACYZUC_10615 [Pseudomonas sp. GT1P32]
MTKEKTLTPDEISRIKTLLSSNMKQREVALETGLSRRQVAKVATKEAASKADNDALSDDQPALMTKAVAIKTTHALSVRPQGVKKSELYPTFSDHFGYKRNDETGLNELNMTRGQSDYLKKKAREIEGAVRPPLFVPDWLPRVDPVEACNTLLRYASALQDRITDMVMDFCEQYPDSHPRRFYEELIFIALWQSTKEPVETRCVRNMTTAEQLRERLGEGSKSVSPVRKIHPAAYNADFDAHCI